MRPIGPSDEGELKELHSRSFFHLLSETLGNHLIFLFLSILNCAVRIHWENVYELQKAVHKTIKVKEFYWSRMSRVAVACVMKIKDNIGSSISQIYLPLELFHLLIFSIIGFRWDDLSKSKRGHCRACLDRFHTSYGKTPRAGEGRQASPHCFWHTLDFWTSAPKQRNFRTWCKKELPEVLIRYSDTQVPPRKILIR